MMQQVEDRSKAVQKLAGDQGSWQEAMSPFLVAAMVSSSAGSSGRKSDFCSFAAAGFVLSFPTVSSSSLLGSCILTVRVGAAASGPSGRLK